MMLRKKSRDKCIISQLIISCLTSKYARWYYLLMFRKCILILLLLIVLPSFAGVFEDASKENEKILLYMYAKDCKYCVEFQPIYEKMLQKHGKDCKFLKIDANTAYGNELMQRLNAFYVPYVVLINNRNQTLQNITPTCILNYACVKDAVEKFVN